MERIVSQQRDVRSWWTGTWRIVLLAAFMSMLVQPTMAAAGEEDYPDRFSLRLGGYRVQDADTIIRNDSNNAPVGMYIDFHDTLGGETSATVLRADGLYRFNDRHALGFAWYNIKFNGSADMGKDISWGDIPITQSTHVDSELKFDVVKLNYQYSLFHNEKAELGAVAGLHIMKLSIELNTASQSYTEAITAPLPVFGVFANYHFDPRFSVFYNYQFFFINYDNRVKGGLQDMLLGLEYRLTKHVALGGAFNHFAFNIENTKENNTVSASGGWNSGMLYAAVYF